MLDITLFRHLWFEVTTSEINYFTVATTLWSAIKKYSLLHIARIHLKQDSLYLFYSLNNGTKINKELFTCEVQGEMFSSVKLELLWVSKQTQRVYIGFGTHMQEVTSQIQEVTS